MDRPKRGTSMSLPPLYTIPLTLLSHSPTRFELFGVSVCVCLKNWRYLRAFVFSVSSRVAFFRIFFFCCFSFLFFSFFVFCVHFVYFSRLVFCFFYAFAVLSLFFSRWIMHAGRPPIWVNTVRCQRRRVQRGLAVCEEGDWGLRKVA